MHLTKKDLEITPKIRRLNIINSVTGIKPANLIGTKSKEGLSNLAIFSSLVHLGSNPGLLGMILRPEEEVRRHTAENIRNTGFYTINMVHPDMIAQAHYTSAKFKEGVSEFDQCQLTEWYLPDFPAPFVKESHLKIGMQFQEAIPIPINKTTLIIGVIEHLLLPEEVVADDGQLDLQALGAVGISGLNRYYQLEKIGEFPYARPDELPEF